MNRRTLATALFGALTHWGASAHEGHGLAGSAHWHATDVLGFVAVVLVAAAVWYFGKDK